MSNIVALSKDEERMEAANRWVLRIDEGLTENDEVALKTWLSADPQNLDDFLEAAQVWDESATLSRLAELFPQAPKRAVWRPRFAAAAASVVLLLAASFFFIPKAGFNGIDSVEATVVTSAVQRFETAIGEQSTVVLADGTVVVLNTNSQIDVVYTDRARVLHLLRGEIHVEVFKDPSRLLSVIAGDRILQAVGTSFSVEITQDQRIDLVVTEGRVVVGVHTPSNQRSVTPPILTQSDLNTVTAGEELLMGSGAEVVTSVSAEEIEVKLSWRQGSLTFSSEPLEKALMEMERYTNVKFVFLDEDLKARSVSGRFRAGDVEALLVALRLNFNITHEVAEDGRVLLSSL